MAAIQSQSPGRIVVSGELTADTAPALESEGQRLLAAGSGRCEVDLAEVSFGSSVGVALLLAWLRAGRAGGREVVFCNVPAGMRSIVNFSGLDSIIPVADP